MVSDLKRLNARKVQMNFSIDPELFMRLCDFMKNNGRGSRSGVLTLLINMLVCSSDEARQLLVRMRPEHVGMIKHVGMNVAVMLKEIEERK